VTQLRAQADAGGPSYRGRRLDRSIREFRAAVDLLAVDTVSEAYYQRVQQRQRGEQRRAAGPLRLLVCGSRDWTDADLLADVVDRLVAEHGRVGVVLIEGGARGADRLAGELARARGWQLETYPADWQRHGRAAGLRRNARMLHEGRPERVLAFTDDLTSSRGTADMVRRARAAGLPVLVVGHQPQPRREVMPSTPAPAPVQELPFP
jgi:SLOG family YspA-like protein